MKLFRWSWAVGLLMISVAAFAETSAPPAISPGEITTFEQAWSLVQERHPALRAAAADVASAQAIARQEGRTPNPALELEAEELGGSGDLSGFDNAALSVHLSQTLELAGKPGRRRSVGDENAAVAEISRRVTTADLLLETQIAVLSVAAAERASGIAAAQYDQAAQLLDIVSARLDAGQISPLERDRAAVQLLSANLARERATSGLTRSRDALASLWGGQIEDVGSVAFHFNPLIEPAAFEELWTLAQAHSPELQLASREEAAQIAALKLERALASSDLDLALGYQHFRESGDHALVLGIGIELPLMDRNRDGIAAAEQALVSRSAAREALELAIERDLRALQQELRLAYSEARQIEGLMSPLSEQALRGMEEGYRHGKFGLLDVLDALDAVLESSALLLETQVNYHTTRFALERLIGAPLDAAATTLQEDTPHA